MSNLKDKKIRFNQSTEYNTALSNYETGHVYFTNNNNDTNNNAIILEGKIYGAAPLVELQYSQLTALVTNKKLIPGTNYKITNYITTTSQDETQSGGHQFDIIVTALSENQLSENARACKHKDDNYFLHDNLSAWEIKYCLENDSDRFAWASPTGTGVIYYMKDEHNNEAYYDFKNIMFLRSGTWIRDNCYNISALPKDTSKWIDTYFYTFSALSSHSGIPGDDSRATGDGVYHATDNHLGKESSLPIRLNNTIFIDTPNNGAFNNRIADGHRDNTFGQNVWNNIIEYNFRQNFIGDNFQSNKIGSSCKNNTITKSFVRNIINDDFQHNILYCAVNKTTFGTAFNNNQFQYSKITISNCTFGSNNCNILASTSESTEYVIDNVTFANNCFPSTFNGSMVICQFLSLLDINNNLIINELNKPGEKYLIRNEETNKHIVFNHWNEKEIIDRLTDNIYDLGVVDSSSTAETQASNANVCTNKDILFIKYTVGNNVGLITQHVTDGATYQYINWNGFLKYKKITWTIIGGNATTTTNPSWTNLFNSGNGDLYANGVKLQPSNYVTTNSEQTINGVKTFTQNIKINEKDIIISGDTVIKGSIDAGEFKVFDNKTANKGFTIRTVNSKTNDLYPVQILATNNSKSVQYRLPLTGPRNSIDDTQINLPVNTPINIITECTYATQNTFGAVKICSLDPSVIDSNNAYLNSYTSASMIALHNTAYTLQKSIDSIKTDFDIMSTTTAEALADLDTRINNISVNAIQEEIDENAEVTAAAIVDLNERLTYLETLVNTLVNA